LAIARRAQWRNPEDLKASHPLASILKFPLNMPSTAAAILRGRRQ